MKHTIIGLYAAIGGLVSCATPPASPGAPVNGAAVVSNEPVATSLPPQKLETNECGLFMWSKTAPSSFVFFNKAGENTAMFLMDGKTTPIRTISFGGDIFGQFFTNVDYQTDTGKTVSVSYAAGEDIANGARISSGVIRYKNDKDWLITLPIVGVRFCQPLQTNADAAPFQPPAQ